MGGVDPFAAKGLNETASLLGGLPSLTFDAQVIFLKKKKE
jgi:hypothetical protein